MCHSKSVFLVDSPMISLIMVGIYTCSYMLSSIKSPTNLSFYLLLHFPRFPIPPKLEAKFVIFQAFCLMICNCIYDPVHLGDKFIRDWSLITGRGGLQNGKMAGLKLLAAPPPYRQGKTFSASPPPFFFFFKRVETSNFFRPPPLFVWVKLHLPLPFCSPPPSNYSDQSLTDCHVLILYGQVEGGVWTGRLGVLTGPGTDHITYHYHCPIQPPAAR